MLVTCWQSKTQITHRYDKLADAVLGGHRSKVFFPGIDDPATVDYLTKVAGAHHVPQRSWSAEVHGGHRSVSEQPRREDLVPGHVIRQLAPNDAVLVHGTLPPVHLRLVDWWRDPQLRRRIPTGGDTRPVPPTGVATCPLAGEPADEPRPVPDPAIVEDPARRLASHPGPVRGTKKAGTAAGRSPSATGTDQVGTHRTLPDNVRRLDARADGDRDESRPNRVAGVCERCAGWVPVGVGTSIRVGGRDWLRCATCAGTRPPQAP
jgi:hypothetical protein